VAALGLAAHEVLHVGDSLTADVAGARAAGIRTAWINRHGHAAPHDLPIGYEITNLGELLAAIS
jgi:FMN phosphatase YigB (HAD superfamily)